MGQQPNIELDSEDRPLPEAAPGPARRWQPGRPGELTEPGEVPWGGAFGTAGPDGGFAYALAAARRPRLRAGERRRDVDVVVGAIAAARASRFARGPTVADVDVSLLILGLDEQLAEPVADLLGDDRGPWVRAAGHDEARARRIVAAIPVDLLVASPVELRERLAAGERPLSRSPR